MSSNSNSKNHYDTLNVKQNATQEEIKSSYYNLTKQYHPDVNKTTEAEGKFREVSEAYEILGNYQNRRQYDRGMVAQGMKIRSTTDENINSHMGYKSRMDTPIRRADTKVYDFDAWTQAHYGHTFKRTLSRKQTNINLKVYRAKCAVDEKRSMVEFSVVVTFSILVILLSFSAGVKENFDEPILKGPEMVKEN